MFQTEIGGRQFLICTERTDDQDRFLGEWHAWCFFAYDSNVNVYPADLVPEGVVAQESIAGGFGNTEEAARQAVEQTLRRVGSTRNLAGTGFYSPPARRTYPQDFVPPGSLPDPTG